MTDLFLSLNEIESACQKAFRAAGYEWGLAQEGAKANKYMIQMGVSCIRSLWGLLNHKINHPDTLIKPDIPLNFSTDHSGTFCPVLTGCAISDFYDLHGLPNTIKNVAFPLQLAGILSMLSRRYEITFKIMWENAEIFCGSGAISALGSGINAERTSTMFVHLMTDAENRGYPVLDKDWHVLQTIMAKTYVPASEQSKFDAGSTLSDND